MDEQDFMIKEAVRYKIGYKIIEKNKQNFLKKFFNVILRKNKIKYEVLCFGFVQDIRNPSIRHNFNAFVRESSKNPNVQVVSVEELF